MRDQQPVGRLLEQCVTNDQALAVLALLERIAEKEMSGRMAITAGRGRGKSAALGFAISGAIALGYSNILVTAPSP